METVIKKSDFVFTFSKRATTREGRFFQSKAFKKGYEKHANQFLKFIRETNPKFAKWYEENYLNKKV